MIDIPNTYYRGTVKAVIRDSNGFILVAKESDDFIDLPGGGIDHGESYHEAMRRELAEEIGYEGDFTMELTGSEVLERKNSTGYVMFVIFNVTLSSPYTAAPGPDTTEVLFIDPEQYKNEKDRSLQMIYKYGSNDKSAIVDYISK